ncbi:flagellar basal body-associated FliL family protein [Succinimonas sp.]|uniref:flagellar basal body-associated FliL family protein n=1 Tax=Succinimonas sp. TaxID=1936151 RepID=UPI003863A49D
MTDGNQEQQLNLGGDDGGKKKKLLIIIIAAAVLLLGGGGAAVALSGGDSGSAEEPQVQLPGAPAPGIPEILYLNIKKPFVIQIPTKPRHRMMQVKMQITVNSQDNLDLATLHEPLIKNAISEVLYKYQNQPDIYNMIEGRREVKAACLKEVQEAMLKETGKPVVEKVLFTDFVMQ